MPAAAAGAMVGSMAAQRPVVPVPGGVPNGGFYGQMGVVGGGVGGDGGLALYQGTPMGSADSDDDTSEEEDTDTESGTSSEDVGQQQLARRQQQQIQQQRQVLNNQNAAVVASGYPKETRVAPASAANLVGYTNASPSSVRSQRPPPSSSSTHAPLRELPRRTIPSSSNSQDGFGRSDAIDPFASFGAGGLLAGGLFGAIGRRVDRMLSQALDGMDGMDGLEGGSATRRGSGEWYWERAGAGGRYCFNPSFYQVLF